VALQLQTICNFNIVVKMMEHNAQKQRGTPSFSWATNFAYGYQRLFGKHPIEILVPPTLPAVFKECLVL
jgi:hypothetical protein